MSEYIEVTLIDGPHSGAVLSVYSDMPYLELPQPIRPSVLLERCDAHPSAMVADIVRYRIESRRKGDHEWFVGVKEC